MDVFISERAIASKFQIEAKECKIERESDSGVCMFNYECYKRKGTVLGTCIDGFLFGACCRLPKEGEDEELVDITEEDDEVSTKKPDSSDETVSILSDLLSKSDLESIDEIINELIVFNSKFIALLFLFQSRLLDLILFYKELDSHLFK